MHHLKAQRSQVPTVRFGVIVVLYAAHYHPIVFAILCPFGLGLIVGTVYGRFHYALDAILGTVLAIAIFGVAPHLYRLWS